MQGPFLRQYGEAATINFHVFEVDGINLRKDAVIGTADLFVMKDNDAEAAAGSAATDRGRGYSLALTVTEMQAKRIAVYIEDQSGTKVWLDDVIVIETIDHPSAQHTNGVTEAGTAQTGAASTITLRSAAIATNDMYKGQICEIYEGTGAGQSRPIISYVGSTKIATISGTWAVNPDSTSKYKLRPDAVTEITVPSASDNANANYDLDISSKTVANTAGKKLNDVAADTADMQPKIGTPGLGTLAAHLPVSLSSGGWMKCAVITINGKTVTGDGTPSVPFAGGAAE